MARGRSPALVVNEQGSLKEKFIYYSIGFVVVFYASVLCGASWTEGCGFNEWCNNFCQFILVEHHFIVGFTAVTPKVILVFESIWTLGYLFCATKIQHPFRGREHGHAEWGNPKNFTKKFGNSNKNYLVRVNFGDLSELEPEKPVYVNTHNYWLAENVYLSIDNKKTSNLNFLVIGPPGTGKTFRIARPILSQLAGNYLVTDVKGELSQQTGQYMEDNGYGVFVINVESEETMGNGHHFNPFRYIENESDILGLCEILFKATTKPDATNGEQFFEDMAQVLLTCIFYYMHYTYDDSKKNWRAFVELLNSTAVKQDPRTGGIDLSDENHFFNRYRRANIEWKKTHNGSNLKGYEDVEKIFTGAQETSSSIVSSLDAHCKYMKLDCVIDLLSEDDLNILNTFGRCKKSKFSKTGKYILYIVTSENKRYFDWILSMIYSLFIDKLYHLCGTDEKLHQTLPEHLTFLMDEFYNVTLPDSFVGLTSTMRSRGISVIAIIQNLYQLKDKFPKNDQDKNLRSNMAIKLILGAPNDMNTCEELSKEFGNRTIHKQTTGLSRGSQGSFSENEDVMQMPLFPPEDIMSMDKEGPLAMRLAETNPLLVEKVRFEDSPLLPLLTRKNHYKPKQKVVIGKTLMDRNKSPCEQFPDFIFGKDAEAFVKNCLEDGIKVVSITEKELDAVATLDNHNIPLTGSDATTKEYWKKIGESTERALEEAKRNSLDLDSYNGNQIITVQKLRNAGFEPSQINALNELIRAGYPYEELITYFGTHMAAKEILDFAGRLARLQNKNQTN